MGAFAPSHWMILGIVALVLFLLFNGASKLPELARGLGRSARIVKSEFDELKNDDAQRERVLEEKKQTAHRISTDAVHTPQENATEKTLIDSEKTTETGK